MLPLVRRLHGRRSTARRSRSRAATAIFAAVTDFVYVPRDATRRDRRRRAAGGSRYRAPAPTDRLEARHVPPTGSRSSCAARARPAARSTTSARRRRSRSPTGYRRRGPDAGRELVLLPAAQARRGRAGPVETALEEIYYFEVAPSRRRRPRLRLPARLRLRAPGGRSTSRAEVRAGDVIVMPHGYHGPSMAAPGYDLYYLNVMAGAGRARVAVHRRPGARLDPRDVGGPGPRPAAAA